MEILENNNAKNKYEYYFTWYKELTQSQLRSAITNYTPCKQSLNNGGVKRYSIGGKKYGKTYLDIPCSFDIETSKYKVNDTYYSTMYCWQFAINKTVIMGRYWYEFVNLLDNIQTMINPKKKQRLLVAVHNLGFEFSFMRDWLNVTDSFLKEQRVPLTIEHNNFMLFIDTYALTQQKLSKLAETYTNTQKCVNDLDYSLLRHSESYLNDVELSYCHNDVLILTEYMRYYNDTFLNNGKRPLTATGVLNDEVQQGFNAYCTENPAHKNKIQFAQPNKQDYEMLMTYCYRGGYVHGNKYYIDENLENVPIMGVDFTSSYPSVILYRKYGVKWRKAYNINTVEDIHNLYKNDRASIFIAKFYNVNSKTGHSIESKSKVIEVLEPIIDNGRIEKCESMTVYITMLDLFNYERFYTWDSIEISNVIISKMEYLPSYLVEPMLKYYTLKNELKSKGLDGTLDYNLSKSKVNSFYGLTVKRIPLKRVVYTNDGWREEDATEYEKQVEKKALLPYYGVFVSAWARYNLLQSVAELEENGVTCYYMDTDSIKCDDTPTAHGIINRYNDNIKLMTKDAKKRTGCNDFVDGLGEFDIEYGDGTKHGNITNIKILGAKRYMLVTDKGYKLQTIAGLPKGWIFEEVEKEESEYYKKDPFEIFTNNMKASNCKLTTKYIDSPFSHNITDYNGVPLKINELSCVSLVETDFSMKIDEMWLSLIMQEKETDKYFV